MTPPLLYLQCVLVVCHSSDVPASRRVLPVHTLPAVRTLPAVHTPTLLHLLFLINLSSYSSSANAPFVLSTNAPSPPPAQQLTCPPLQLLSFSRVCNIYGLAHMSF
eukprot:GHVS01048100.1.p1 GENE.GHVS01048100.1~~GHVS01048100.1.p1  ORF type:complete len:106 (-),score=14.63 GHVS01048100.1:78-395(-)